MEAEAAIAADEETNSQSNSIATDEETDPQPSLNTSALIRKATTPADISPTAIEDWCSVLHEGVLLENNTQKFWVDKKLQKNCFLVLPKACDIDRSKGSHLSWITEKENCAVDIHVIELKELSWLLIEGRFKTGALSLNTEYEVAFVVKPIETDREWQHPVELELVLPDEIKQTRTENLKPNGGWINLCAGEFTMGPMTVGTIYFALHETFDPQISGLILRGVLIQPKMKPSEKV